MALLDYIEFQLSKFVENDFNAFYEIVRSDRVMKYIRGKGMNKEQAQASFNNMLKENLRHSDFGYYKIVVPDLEEVIGMAKMLWDAENMYSIEISFLLKVEYWKRGIGHLIALHLLESVKSHWGIQKVIVHLHVENLAAQKIILGLGFSKKYKEYLNGQMIEVYELSLRTYN